MDDTDELELALPEPPPWPDDQPVPLEWEFGTEEGRRRRRRHRLAVLNGACAECLPPPGEPTTRDFLRELEHTEPLDPGARPPAGSLVTPEGELASFVHGVLEVEDRTAFTGWADRTLTRVGEVFAHVRTVDDAPWVGAMLWFDDDDDLHLEASGLDRYLHLEVTLQCLWPPVFRGSRTLARLDERLDARFRPEWPAPPAEATVFTRLEPVPSSRTSTGSSAAGAGP